MVKLDVMEQNEMIRKFLPPRVVDSITSGVSRIEKQPYLLLFPVLFDLLLWLGPNLSIKQPVMRLYEQFLTNTEAIYQMANVDPQPLFDFQNMLSEFLSSYNLFSVFMTFPIGIPGLLSNADTLLTPLGNAQILSISSTGTILLLSLVLAFFGIFVGSIFLRTIAPKSGNQNEISLVQEFLNSLVYSILLIVAVAVGLLAALFISSFFAIFFPLLGQFVFSAIIMTLIFFLIPAFYAFVPIFMYGQSFYQAIVTSYKIVGLRIRYKIDEENTVIFSPKIISFTMFIFILYQGLNIIWLRIPPIDTWWMLLGILGHGFVSTMIILACFDFFQKMCDWHQRITHNEVC